MEEKTEIENRNELLLSTVIHSPGDKKRHPAVILLHGFTGYKDEEQIVSLGNELAQNSFVAVRFDCSGYGESEGTTKEDYRLSNYLQDIHIMYEYLLSRDDVNPKRIGIWGHSMGALASIVYAADHRQIKAVCAVSSPLKLGTSDWLRRVLPEWKRTGWFERTSSRYGKVRIPYAFMEDGRQYDALKSVKKLTQPLCVIIGTEDDTVNPADTKKIFDATPGRKELHEIPGMGHDYKKNKEQMKNVNTIVINFFQRCIFPSTGN